MITNISFEQLNQMLYLRAEGKEDFLLVNVLGHEIHRKKHIPSSVSIDVDDELFVDKVLDINANDKSQKIIVYCKDKECKASSNAVVKLENAGLENIYDFIGGLKEWNQNGGILWGEE